jgi:4-amino-4-deoxy-L-arabinose transferase-like glycosyltransferase
MTSSENSPEDPGSPRLEALAAVLLAIASLVFVFDHDAWTPDEPRVVGLARSVAEGSWAVPRLNGVPFLEQPPLYYDAVAVAFRAFGFEVTVARAVSVLFGAATLGATFVLGRELAGRRVGALSALALGFSVAFWLNVHRIVVDPALAFFVVASAAASVRGLGAKPGPERTTCLILAYALASLAYLAKGVVGVGLAAFAFIATVIARREPRLLLGAHLWAAPLVFAAVTGPYHLALHGALGDQGLRELLVENGLGRALGTAREPSHIQPFYFYLVYIVPDLLPTVLPALAGVVAYARRRRALAASERIAYEMPLLWFALGFGALSLASSKREVYLLPVLPGAAVVAALWLDGLLAGRESAALGRGLAYLVGAFVVAGGVALPFAAVELDRPWLLGAGGLVAAALGIAGIVRARRDRLTDGLAALACGLVSLLVAAVLVVVPYVDAQKRLGPFLTRAGERIPPSRPVYVVFPDEAGLGSVPFYTGRAAVPLWGHDDLARRLGHESEAFVIAMEKADEPILYNSLADLAPEVVLEEVRPGSRTLRLLRFEAAAGKRRP